MAQMNRADLAELDGLLASEDAVVPMRNVFAGARDSDVIGLRHDVDDNPGSLETAVRIAEWEAERDYRATFFILHTASYWERPGFQDLLERIASLGHEIGIHANAIAEALRTGGDPAAILTEAIERLRRLGHTVVGVAPHGDALCYGSDRVVRFVNDEMFSECARPGLGAPDRKIWHNGRRVRLSPQPLSDFGLQYESYRLPRGRTLSDSGGSWNEQPSSLVGQPGQLHVLWHPDWWGEVFEKRGGR